MSEPLDLDAYRELSERVGAEIDSCLSSGLSREDLPYGLLDMHKALGELIERLRRAEEALQKIPDVPIRYPRLSIGQQHAEMVRIVQAYFRQNP